MKYIPTVVLFYIILETLDSFVLVFLEYFNERRIQNPFKCLNWNFFAKRVTHWLLLDGSQSSEYVSDGKYYQEMQQYQVLLEVSLLFKAILTINHVIENIISINSSGSSRSSNSSAYFCYFLLLHDKSSHTLFLFSLWDILL